MRASVVSTPGVSASPVQGIAGLDADAQDAVQPIALRACGNASGDRPPAAMIPLPSLVERISPRGFVLIVVLARDETRARTTMDQSRQWPVGPP